MLVRPHRPRRGSVLMVLFVVVILGTLGGVAVMMSGNLSRTQAHEKLIDDAQLVARAAVEEASLLLNNGKRNMQISEALSTEAAVEVPLARVPGTPVGADGASPQVFVKATVIDPRGWKEEASQQMVSIQRSILPSADHETQAFWNRVDQEGLQGHGWSGASEGDCEDCFMKDWVEQVGLSKWKPTYEKSSPEEVRTITNENGESVQAVKWGIKDQIPELAQVHSLFYESQVAVPEGQTETEGAMESEGGGWGGHQETGGYRAFWFPEGHDPNSGANVQLTPRSKPSVPVFKAAWEGAIRAVARDASQRVEACGANPSLAMAHLVGDLKLGNVIASGAEVEATASFMRDRTIGASKTYLLELTGAMGYEGAGQKMKGKTGFRTYRILQKAEWEMAMDRMTQKLVKDLQALEGGVAMAPADFAAGWPAQPGVEGRDAVVPDKDGNPSDSRWDPKAFFQDIVFSELPSTVGARLYPYGVATVGWNPGQAAAADARAP